MEKPIIVKNLSKIFKPRDPLTKKGITVEKKMLVSGTKEPVVSTKLKRITDRYGNKSWEVLVAIDGVDPTKRSLPAPMKGNALKPTKKQITEEEVSKYLTGFIPDHLGFNAMPREFQKGRKTIHSKVDKRNQATTIFGTDDRRIFRDISYPWSTVGLVQTNRGPASGVMIGPRHLLTVSHEIDWTAPAGYAADWVKFTPSYYDGSAPFGEAYGIHIYWFVKEDGDGFISGDESKYDYAVVVLDSRIGERTGWMGARGYDDNWNDLAAWSHMGYPVDLNGGQRPSWQGGFKVTGTDAGAQAITHKADVFPGQSGGPVFGFWPGDVGPRAIAVQSYQNSSNNGASGSMDMRNLVVRARSEFA